LHLLKLNIHILLASTLIGMHLIVMCVFVYQEISKIFKSSQKPKLLTWILLSLSTHFYPSLQEVNLNISLSSVFKV
jgi:hypothetical protein